MNSTSLEKEKTSNFSEMEKASGYNPGIANTKIQTKTWWSIYKRDKIATQVKPKNLVTYFPLFRESEKLILITEEKLDTEKEYAQIINCCYLVAKSCPTLLRPHGL